MMETVFAYILESTTLQHLASLQPEEERTVIVTARDALGIHEATVQRMEYAVKEIADLQEKLQKARNEIERQDQVIRSMRGQRDPVVREELQAVKEKLWVTNKQHNAADAKREYLKKIIDNLKKDLQEERKTHDYLIKECDELKSQAMRDDVLAANACDEANEHIKKQNDEITRLQVEADALRRKISSLNYEQSIFGDSVPSYRTMKKNFIEAITKIELYKVRLANCRYCAEQICATYDSPVGRLVNRIITETELNTKEKIDGQP